MVSDRELGWRRDPVASVCVAHGFAVRVSVDHGRLVVRDGIGRAPRTRTYGRATHGLERLVIFGHRGYLTLEAARWLADVGVGFLQIDTDGRILSASTGLGLDDPRLRRAQALAWNTPTGVAIARELLRRKIAGQARIAERLGAPEVAAQVDRIAKALEDASTPAELLVPEAAAAGAYWSAWAPLELRWAKADQPRIPDHWRTVGGRASPITGNPRLAANPTQAILNFVYALLEAEARLACLSMGLDPGLGVLHADQRARDSLALDVMEAVRPDVDAFVLDVLARRTFRRVDFFETRQGVCRIVPPLTHELAATIPAWSARLGPVVEWVAKALFVSAGPGTRRVPTLLTGANRSAGRAGHRQRGPRSATRGVSFASTCRTCGGPTPVGGREYCDKCLPSVVEEQRAAFRSAGTVGLAALRAEGIRPGVGGDAGRERGRKIAASRRAAREWEAEHPGPCEPADFQRDILPGLAGVTPRVLAAATGLSRHYCAAILRGARVPHPRWWDALRRLENRQGADVPEDPR